MLNFSIILTQIYVSILNSPLMINSIGKVQEEEMSMGMTSEGGIKEKGRNVKQE